MPREQSYQAIIIKKQPFGEADEIITFFTEEVGKLRALAKSVKLGTSRLQQTLQPVFLNRVRLAGNGGLPKVIGAQSVDSFSGIHADPRKVNIWFVVAELLYKSLADEQRNGPLFGLVLEYMEFLNGTALSDAALATSLVKFKIEFLRMVGLEIHSPAVEDGEAGILFSANRGGFYVGRQSSDAQAVSSQTWRAFNNLQTTPFPRLADTLIETGQLPDLVNSFISWQLEREMKAERFLS